MKKQSRTVKIAKYYKLDTLSYAAEDKDGNIVATLGELPPRIESEMDLLAMADNIESESIEVNSRLEGGEEQQGVHFLAKNDPTHPIELKAWGATKEEAWQQLKSRGAPTYRHMARSLEKAAEQEWETDELAETYGEGLMVGRTLKLALLFPGASIHASGPGAEFASIEKVEVAPGRETLLVVADEADEEEEVMLLVRIDYGKGLTEDIPFTIVPMNEVREHRRELGDWGPWHYYWAGYDTDQRYYHQIDANTGPNTSSCASGCGATAWAMLFGWADYCSTTDTKWQYQWCMYLQNGGVSTPNVVAPPTQDSGVENMTWEIRNDVGTFCWFGDGATEPWNMINAYKYVQARSCSYSMSTDYHPLGITTSDLREKARNIIRDLNTPAIIGTGWLSHYPVAFGYAWRSRTVRKCFIWCWYETQYSRWFYVNQGWGHSSYNDWVSADTWFVGKLQPYS